MIIFQWTTYKRLFVAVESGAADFFAEKIAKAESSGAKRLFFATLEILRNKNEKNKTVFQSKFFYVSVFN